MGTVDSNQVPIQMAETNSLRSIDNSQKLTADNIIHCLAIDPSAGVGSLYDAKEDRLLETPALNIPSMSVTSLASSIYPPIDIGILDGEFLPDIIRIDKELCLSIYLNITASAGISLLTKYPYAINKYTRFLSYYYPTKQTYFNGKENVIKSKVILKSICPNAATHIVTSIQSGVHVIVILQLSPKYESKLDRLLEKIKNQLTANIFRIEPNEEHLFDHFTDINVFSDIPDITKLTKLTDVCQKITAIVPNVTQHPALKYTLQPIISFFPSYPTDRRNYYSLKREHMNQIETYVTGKIKF